MNRLYQIGALLLNKEKRILEDCRMLCYNKNNSLSVVDMSENPFVDESKPPTRRAIFKAIGVKKEYWKKLEAFVKRTYELKAEPKLMGKSWVMWVRKSNKTLVTFHPGEKGFVVQVVLGKKEVEKANLLKFGKNVADVYKKAKQYHDGKWLFIEVKSKKDIEDVKRLLVIKRRPLKK